MANCVGVVWVVVGSVGIVSWWAALASVVVGWVGIVSWWAALAAVVVGCVGVVSVVVDWIGVVSYHGRLDRHRVILSDMTERTSAEEGHPLLMDILIWR